MNEAWVWGRILFVIDLAAFFLTHSWRHVFTPQFGSELFGGIGMATKTEIVITFCCWTFLYRNEPADGDGDGDGDGHNTRELEYIERALFKNLWVN